MARLVSSLQIYGQTIVTFSDFDLALVYKKLPVTHYVE